MRKFLIIAVLFLLPSLAKSQQQLTQVFYVVTAVDATGTESKTSNEAQGTLTPDHSAATLTWKASTSTVSGYNVYRSRVSGGPYTKINTALVTGVTTFTDTFPFPVAPTQLTITVQ